MTGAAAAAVAGSQVIATLSSESSAGAYAYALLRSTSVYIRTMEMAGKVYTRIVRGRGKS